MKSYPSITTKFPKGQKIVAFDKIDGSNIRAEWSKKQGFYKFGTRNRLLDETDTTFGESKNLILEKYADDLNTIFSKQRWERAVAFFEFKGENSFAGNHLDEIHDVTLFDVDVFKKGLLEPKPFLQLFGDLDVPPVLYEGNITAEFIESVRLSTLDGMSFEGVVCKWKHRKLDVSQLCKIKSRAWLDKLKDYCNDDPKMFNRLK